MALASRVCGEKKAKAIAKAENRTMAKKATQGGQYGGQEEEQGEGPGEQEGPDEEQGPDYSEGEGPGEGTTERSIRRHVSALD